MKPIKCLLLAAIICSLVAIAPAGAMNEKPGDGITLKPARATWNTGFFQEALVRKGLEELGKDGQDVEVNHVAPWSLTRTASCSSRIRSNVQRFNVLTLRYLASMASSSGSGSAASSAASDAASDAGPATRFPWGSPSPNPPDMTCANRTLCCAPSSSAGQRSADTATKA